MKRQATVVVFLKARIRTWNIYLKLGSGRTQMRTRYGRVVSPGTGWFEGQGACRYVEYSHTRMICAVEGKHAIVGKIELVVFGELLVPSTWNRRKGNLALSSQLSPRLGEFEGVASPVLQKSCFHQGHFPERDIRSPR
jgi:hypothetical protein